MKTRILMITLLALIAGFVIGIKLSEMIGIIGVLGFSRAVGIKYLAIYLAVVSGIAVNLWDASARRKSKRSMNEK